MSAISDFVHDINNILAPHLIDDIISANPHLAGQLHEIKMNVYRVLRQSRLLQLRLLSDPFNFISAISQSTKAIENYPAVSVMDMFKSALHLNVTKLLNTNYARLNPTRTALNKDFVALQSDFNHQIYSDKVCILDWFNHNIGKLKVEINSPIWDKIKLVESEAAEAMFFAHFNELIFNAFKYADLTKPINLNFDATQINSRDFLTYEWSNHSRDSSLCGSQLGLDSIKSDLTKLNGADYSITNSQDNSFNAKFSIFQSILFYEISDDDKKRIAQNVKRWLAEKD